MKMVASTDVKKKEKNTMKNLYIIRVLFHKIC